MNSTCNSDRKQVHYQDAEFPHYFKELLGRMSSLIMERAMAVNDIQTIFSGKIVLRERFYNFQMYSKGYSASGCQMLPKLTLKLSLPLPLQLFG